MCTCIVGLVSSIRGHPRAPCTNIYASYLGRPRPLLSFFSYPSLHHRSAPSENVPRKGTSFELTVTYANGQARKIYLLGPNILRALVLQSSILLILLINVSGYERSNLSESRVFFVLGMPTIINEDKRRSIS